MYTDSARHRTSEGRKDREFAKTEVVIEYQSQSFMQTISAKSDILPSPQLLQLYIKGIKIITQTVLTRTKRLTGILGSHDSHLHIIAIPELIAYAMLVLITQVTIGPHHIALTFIKRHFQHSHHLMLAILGYSLDTRIILPFDICNIKEIIHQLPLIPTDARNQS